MHALLLALIFSAPSLVLAASGAGAHHIVAHFDFEEATGFKEHGVTLLGRPEVTLGRIGSAMHFDGFDDSAEIPHVLNDAHGTFSVSAWVKLDRMDQTAVIISQDGAFRSDFSLNYQAPAARGGPGSFGLSMATDDAWYPEVRIAAPFTPVAQVWYHLAVVVDSGCGEMSLYVDGARAARAPIPSAFSASGGWAVGRGLMDGVRANFFPGTLDEIAVADRAWHVDDVLALYNRANPVTPIRPPSVPLMVRSPYVSTWLPSENAAGTWPTFWTGAVKALTVYLRVDGKTYLVLGNPAPSAPKARQQQLEVTPTQTRYVFSAGGVNLYVNFISPVEPSDLRRMSAPLAYIEAQAVAVDGGAHDTSFYMDMSGEWAHGDSATPIIWDRHDIGHAGLSAFAIQPAKPQVLREYADYASWGTALWVADAPNLAWQAGPGSVLREHFVRAGALRNGLDNDMPWPIHASWPVFAYVSDFGTVVGTPSRTAHFAVGHVRQPPATFLDKAVPALWQSYWNSWQAMVGEGMADFASGDLLVRANELDARILHAATAAGGPKYAALCALVLRQAFGGAELVNSPDDPWLFLKEISSNGNVQTVDMIYASMPAFLYANPHLVRYLLTPLFNYAESGLWPQSFAEHDLGISYPNAAAHNDGGGENMPVEESANMVLMTAAYLQRTAAADLARAWVHKHYATLKRWTDYLVDNALDPAYQNQTDDFTGFIGHSSNLALKGILGIGAMAQMADTLGYSDDARNYRAVAEDCMDKWVAFSLDTSREHLKLAYDQDGTWSLKYNAFPDKLLGLGLVSDDVLALESHWYRKQRGQYGFPLDNRHTYAKADWQLWAAAATGDPALRTQVIASLYDFANETPSRVPFADWYNVHTGHQVGFQARPVLGSLFALLLLPP